VTIGREAGEIGTRMEHISKGAKAAGRTIGPDFHTAVLTAGCVLRPGEKLTDERVINETGSWVTCELHFYYEIWEKHGERDDMIPPHFANVWDDYLRRVKSLKLPDRAHQEIGRDSLAERGEFELSGDFVTRQ
jgi:hypothetical protein